MSYYEFRTVSGADNLIDFNEFLEITRQKYPHLDQQTIYQIAKDKYALMDKNADGKINYSEFAEAKFRQETNPINYQQPYVRQGPVMYAPTQTLPPPPSYQQYHQYHSFDPNLPTQPPPYYQHSPFSKSSYY
ncbi:unnamed protein product [Brachionus calyciflorus]|uniref:EF-hand domain-containing protein n=1 Tax=Brachionus calyciflorus TaxID=104777 RepID=A0A813U4K1_9BILA|nr:unnamed protein product [Brachionus calyciflorus]